MKYTYQPDPVTSEPAAGRVKEQGQGPSRESPTNYLDAAYTALLALWGLELLRHCDGIVSMPAGSKKPRTAVSSSSFLDIKAQIRSVIPHPSHSRQQTV